VFNDEKIRCEIDATREGVPSTNSHMTYLVEVATRAKRNPGAVLLPADFKTAA